MTDNSLKKSGPFGSCSPDGERAVEELQKTIKHHLLSFLGRDPSGASDRDLCKAISYVMRDNLIERWVETQNSYYEHHKKRVYYLSLEFLVGRSLGNRMINLGFEGPLTEAVAQLGYDLDEVREQ